MADSSQSDPFLNHMAHILVVCTANICRSPVVEGLIRDRLSKAGFEEWTVSSVGTWALQERPPSRYSQELMLEWEGIDISGYRAKIVDQAEIDRSDLIICMEKGHVEALKIEFGSATDRIYLLSEMGTGQKFNIADPYGTPKPNYEHMVREVRKLIDDGLPRMVELAETHRAREK